MGRSEYDICVCVLAHNEQKHIASTIKAIVEGNREIKFDIIVYANGCTDHTVPIVKSLCATHPNLRLRELAKASKPFAWNAAFQENDQEILVFSDGDIVPEPGAVTALCSCIDGNSEIVLASCQYWPQKKRLTFGQRITGFLQIPLAQDFLTGCFYAVKKKRLQQEFEKKDITGIPDGIVGEDCFLDSIVPSRNFIVIGKKCYYEPPVFEDYWKYLARIRWQEKQILLFFGSSNDIPIEGQGDLFVMLKRKLSHYQGLKRLFLGIAASMLRCVIVFLNKKKVEKYYEALGPVVRQGGDILCHATRSISAK